MRIKQIELNGFKSFMEPTVLELPAGVTAVVGPNGCGKSNIVDAIRWVLGEQSPKHLRGAQMEDVVFAGNGEHGPLGMAEVSLLLERDEADFARAAADAAGEGEELGEGLPPELANVSEILVTRRYFRSGESEYFINRAACRLRDITELFLGTGVGTKAYAIIEQGRVDQLINAKPEEMRLFIEEAAGTTRFRSRKVAAERKMERTRDNLLRVQDVLRELERQMASLERQARRAEEFHRLKGELRDLDLRVMAGRHRTWSADAVRLRARLTELQEEESALVEEVRRSRGATSELQAARLAGEERLRRVDGDIAEQRLAKSDAQVRGAAEVARGLELSVRVTDGERELERLRGRRDELATEAIRLGAEVSRLEGEEPAVEAERRSSEEQLEALAAAGTPLERGVEEAKDGLLDALGDEARLRNMVEALRQRHEDLTGRRRKVEDEQRALGERLHANGRDTESARATLIRLHAERERATSERAVLAEARRQLATEEEAQAAGVERARAEETRLRSRATSLRELQARYEGCTRGVGNLLGRGKEGAALLAGVLRVPAELERAVAAALGARLGHVVVPDTAAAVDSITWLSGTAGGSATVVPRDPERRNPVIVPAGRRLVDRIEVDSQHWALAEALLGHVLLADDLDEALRVWRDAEHAVTVVTPKGEAIDGLGAVSGGSEAPLEETLLARARELRELDEAAAVSAEAAGREEAALAVLRARAAEAAQATADAEARLHTLHVELVAAEKDRERLEAERERIAAELEVGALEAGGLAGEDGEVTGEILALDERLAEAARAVAERRAHLGERQVAMARWREDHAAAERARTAAAVRVAAIGERVRAARAEVSRCDSAGREVEERVATLARQVREAAEGAEAARIAAAGAETAGKAAEGSIVTLGAERDRLLAEIAQADAALSADDAAERTARERLEALREERGRVDVAGTERRMELEHLTAQLLERYALGVEVLADVQVEAEDDAEERATRAEALRARLVRLGDVNPAAADELQELRSRHEFLVGQRGDLERSLEDLRRTIAKLTRTSRRRFEDTFAAANEKLEDVFPKLFPGGKARLELSTPEEGGEPGIEIVVQPAGKKLQSLSLLSGGEKALTAVALILSLFLIRPTPFCLLDEVDAPLDEANIGRFNALVREMATASQFVLITHNRRTMEAAETLYGITMEKAGVSKVVSVRLREAA
jgi:chromosome segregation protein